MVTCQHRLGSLHLSNMSQELLFPAVAITNPILTQGVCMVAVSILPIESMRRGAKPPPEETLQRLKVDSAG
jgi:hypothetical protein